MSFDDDAKNWDTEKRSKRAKIVADEIRKTVGVLKNSSAMEFGCGTGLISFNLKDEFESITLVDSSTGMMDVLKSKIEKCKANNMFPYQVDIFDENSLNVKFDVIYNSMVLHHIHDVEAMTRRFHESLQEDGCLCIVDLDEEDGSFHKKYPDFDGHNGFNQEELKRILMNVGFKNVESRTFYHAVKDVGGEKVNYSLFLMKARK